MGDGRCKGKHSVVMFLTAQSRRLLRLTPPIQRKAFALSHLFAMVSGKHQIREIMKTPYQHRNPVVRYTLFVIGWISFVLGMIGLLLPVVPTTPFLLLSAACFLRSSPRFYVWLTEHRWWGKYIRYYLNGQGIPRKIKFLIIAMLWITILTSALLIVKIHWLSVMMISVAAIMSFYIAKQPEPALEIKNTEPLPKNAASNDNPSADKHP